MSRRRIRDIRHEEFIAATIKAVAAKGYASVTMTDIARETGSTAASINYYFGSKENLMEATMRQILSELRAAILKNFANAQSPRDRLQAIIDANFDDALFTPARCSVWVQFWSSAPYAPSLARLHRINRARVHSHIVAEVRRIDPENAQTLTTTLQAWMDGIWIEAAQSGKAAPAQAKADAQYLLAQLLP